MMGGSSCLRWSLLSSLLLIATMNCLFASSMSMEMPMETETVEEYDEVYYYGYGDGNDDGGGDEDDPTFRVVEALNTIDTEYCLQGLKMADMNNDNKVSANEYVDFVKFVAPTAVLTEMNVFEDLPLILRSNFIVLACLCLDRGSDQCCLGDNANIAIRPQFDMQSQNNQQQGNLYLICFLTETSIQRVLESKAPTPMPLLPSLPPSPVPTQMPTQQINKTPPPTTTPTPQSTATPTKAPKGGPKGNDDDDDDGDTPQPTSNPTSTPTVAKTASPTFSPSQQPSSSKPSKTPTSPPTFTPSNMPSQQPSFGPSNTPSFGPSNAPSFQPTLSPSKTPSYQPTLSPSNTPSYQPTLSPSNTPSFGPTNTPSQGPSRHPTNSPSDTPSFQPSDIPSFKPSQYPSFNPTPIPTATSQPSATPSSAPSPQPTNTGNPTVTASEQPSTAPSITFAPSQTPSQTPSTQPTTTPSFVPSQIPTEHLNQDPADNNNGNIPSVSPSIAPTSNEAQGDSSFRTSVQYLVTIQNGAVTMVPSSLYEADLISAMDLLATQVAAEVSQNNNSNNNNRLLRRLQVVVMAETPTSIDTIATVNQQQCSLQDGSNDSCNQVSAAIDITSSDGNPEAIAPEFESALNTAIDEGRLRNALLGVTNNPLVGIVDTTTNNNNSNDNNPNNAQDGPIIPAGGGEGVSTGATAGIVAAALVCVVATACLVRRSRDEGEQDESQDKYIDDQEIGEKDLSSHALDRGRQPVSFQGSEAAVAGDATTTSAFDYDYGKRGEAPDNDAYRPPISYGQTPPVAYTQAQRQSPHIHYDQLQRQTKPDTPDDFSASLPGSDQLSVYSSSSSQRQPAGIRTTETEMEPGERSNYRLPATLDNNYNYDGISSRESSAHSRAQNVTVDIDPASPWASSSSSNNNNRSSARGGISTRSSTTSATSDAPDAAAMRDFDQAIQSGDWAAVGATAALLATMAGDTSSQSSSSIQHSVSIRSLLEPRLDALRAAELDRLVAEGDWEGVVKTAAIYEAQEGYESSNQNIAGGSASIASTVTSLGDTYTSETQSKFSTNEEFRQRVTELVAKVVPEEIDNVDEMLVQFRGREDDLLDTLRTMQERAVAQKAREAGNDLAKHEAKIRVANNNNNNNNDRTPSRSNTTASRAAATDSGGDTTATGRSATPTDFASRSISFSETSMNDAMEMRDNLVQAIEAGDWNAVAEAAAVIGDNDSVEILSIQSKASFSNAVANDRARELNDLIERGDWAGIVAAASRFREADTISDEEEEERKLQRLIRLMEAEDALLGPSDAEDNDDYKYEGQGKGKWTRKS